MRSRFSIPDSFESTGLIAGKPAPTGFVVFTIFVITKSLWSWLASDSVCKKQRNSSSCRLSTLPIDTLSPLNIGPYPVPSANLPANSSGVEPYPVTGSGKTTTLSATEIDQVIHDKSAGVLLGIVVAIGAISAGGAWYTGTKIEGVLNNAVTNANKELQTAMAGSNGTASLELVSLERHTFTSTAHYRLKGEGELFGDAPVELLFVDHIEHGPLPFSRLVSLKWLPVMATSNYELEKNPATEKWFAATKGAAPLKGVTNIGYDESTTSTIDLLPLETALDAQSSLKFSGLTMNISASAQAQKVKADGYMDSLKLVTVAEDQAPVQIELNGLTLASNLAKSSFGYYTGANTLELTNSKTTFGTKQSVLGVKGFEMKNLTEESGSNASGRADTRLKKSPQRQKLVRPTWHSA